MGDFRLVRPEKKHESQALEYIKEFQAHNSAIHGVGSLDQFIDNYDEWLKKNEFHRNQRIDRYWRTVPSETFFLMKRLRGKHRTWAGVDEEIVGMVNIRLALNEALWRYGGNIGYSIRPSERRKGYNKINLYLALKFCQKHNIEVAVLDCKADNLGSSKTMRALGGRFVRKSYQKLTDGVTEIDWYMIDVDAALAKYVDQYEQFVSESDSIPS